MLMMNERTTEMTYREELLCLYSDLYKDVYGVRPRGTTQQGWMANADEEAIKAELDWLSKQLEAVIGSSRVLRVSSIRVNQISSRRLMKKFDLSSKILLMAVVMLALSGIALATNTSWRQAPTFLFRVDGTQVDMHRFVDREMGVVCYVTVGYESSNYGTALAGAPSCLRLP